MIKNNVRPYFILQDKFIQPKFKVNCFRVIFSAMYQLRAKSKFFLKNGVYYIV